MVCCRTYTNDMKEKIAVCYKSQWFVKWFCMRFRLDRFLITDICWTYVCTRALCIKSFIKGKSNVYCYRMLINYLARFCNKEMKGRKPNLEYDRYSVMVWMTLSVVSKFRLIRTSSSPQYISGYGILDCCCIITYDEFHLPMAVFLFRFSKLNLM